MSPPPLPALGIHKKQDASGCMGMTCSEALVGVSAAAAGNYPGHRTGGSCFLDKLPKPLRHAVFSALLSPPPSTYTVALTIYFPQFCPRVQSSPSLYFSSHGFSSSRPGGAVGRPAGLLTDNDGLWNIRQGIDKDVGVGRDENLAARRRFDQELCQLRDDVGVQPCLRLLDADDWRRFRMAEHREQAQIAQTTIG